MPLHPTTRQPPLATSLENPSTLNEKSLNEHTRGAENHICEERPLRQNKPVFIENPNQPSSNYQFPKTKFVSQSRSVQCSWFKQYPWLYYSQSEDSLYCYICVNQFHKGNLRSIANIDQAFTTKGF